MLNALVRLRAELGDARVPTRVAMFPSGSTLSRVDATGLTGVDLNALRAGLAASRGATSSVLVDDGPRRWLVGVSWDDTEIRRVEELTERAGFIDVAVDPSPLALARVVGGEITHVRRDAATDQSFGALTSRGVVVAASSLESVGRMTPGLACSDATMSVGWFDDVDEPQELVAQVHRLLGAAHLGLQPGGRRHVGERGQEIELEFDEGATRCRAGAAVAGHAGAGAEVAGGGGVHHDSPNCERGARVGK